MRAFTLGSLHHGCSQACRTYPAVGRRGECGFRTADAAVITRTPGDLLVAFVAASGPANAGQQAQVSGGGLTWTLAAREDTQSGDAEIWTATAAKHGLYRVTSALTRSGYTQQLTVVAFASTSGLGKIVTADDRTGAPTASLTTSGAGSWVFAAGSDRSGGLVEILAITG
jgi:hypothetical protein